MNETTRFLLQLIGPSFVIIGLSLALNPKSYLDMLKEWDKSKTLLFMIGLISFVSGLTILIKHNFYTSVGAIIVTVFGWIALIKGVLLLTMPQSSISLGKWMIGFVKYVPFVWMAFGAYIWWLGFFS